MRNRALVRLLGGFALVNVAEWGFVAVLSYFSALTSNAAPNSATM
jgi:hypothetical protein